MSKLGTKKKPCVIRVQTEERLAEVVQLCNERGIEFICGIELDKEEDISDLEKALGII